MDANKLSVLLNRANYCSKPYSGRHMYGKHCPSFTVESDAEILIATLSIVRAAEDFPKEFTVSNDELHEAFRNAATDSMSKGIVVYFPRYTFDEAKP